MTKPNFLWGVVVMVTAIWAILFAILPHTIQAGEDDAGNPVYSAKPVDQRPLLLFVYVCIVVPAATAAIVMHRNSHYASLRAEAVPQLGAFLKGRIETDVETIRQRGVDLKITVASQTALAIKPAPWRERLHVAASSLVKCDDGTVAIPLSVQLPPSAAVPHTPGEQVRLRIVATSGLRVYGKVDLLIRA